MRNIKLIILFLLILCLNNFSFGNVDLTSILLYQNKMEENIQKIIDQYVGKGNALVSIKIVLKDKEYQKQFVSLEKNVKNLVAPTNVEQTSNSLPGYSMLTPTEKNNDSGFTMESVSESTEKFIGNEIDRTIVSLVLDRTLTEEQTETIRNIINRILDLSPTKGDRIDVIELDLKQNITQTENFPKKFSSTLKSTELIKFYVIFIAIFFLVLVILFFIYISATKLSKKISATSQSSSILNKQNEKGNELEIEDNEDLSFEIGSIKNQGIKLDVKTQEDQSLFGFINEYNLNKVSYLLQYATLQQKVAVINFLKPDLAAALLQLLPIIDQKNIVLQLSNESILSQKEVQSFSQEMKNHIEYLAGGKNFTYNMFDYLNNDITKNIIKEVEKENKELAKEIQDNIFVFEDIQYLEKRYLQSIIKKIGIKEFSLAISDTSEEIQKIIFDSLSEGMREMLQQSLKLQQKQPKSRVQEKQHKVVQILRSLNQEGLISNKGQLLKENKQNIEKQQKNKKEEKKEL